MKNTRKSLVQVIVCLRKIPGSFFFVLPLSYSNSLEGKRQITEIPARTVGIYLLAHRSLSDPFLLTHPRRRKGLVLRRLLIPFRSHIPQQRSSVGVKSLRRDNMTGRKMRAL